MQAHKFISHGIKHEIYQFRQYFGQLLVYYPGTWISLIKAPKSDAEFLRWNVLMHFHMVIWKSQPVSLSTVLLFS